MAKAADREKLRKDIILSTIEVFNDRGVIFTMSDVATNIHISKKTIYKEFDSKEELEEKLNDNLVAQGLTTDELTYAVVRNSQELIYTPSQGYVALATGISIVGIALYFAFRFRPSRGLSVLLVTTGTTAIAYGVMVGMRFIGTTAITSLAMPIVAVTMMLAS